MADSAGLDCGIRKAGARVHRLPRGYAPKAIPKPANGLHTTMIGKYGASSRRHAVKRTMVTREASGWLSQRLSRL